jgi:hypothetical protein
MQKGIQIKDILLFIAFWSEFLLFICPLSPFLWLSVLLPFLFFRFVFLSPFIFPLRFRPCFVSVFRLMSFYL